MNGWESVAQESNLGPGQTPDVMVVIPTILGREPLLNRALCSIRGEGVKFIVSSVTDLKGHGPAVARNSAVQRGIEAYGMVEWIAFLDDDDEFRPGHLTKLIRHAQDTGAEVVYPWFDLMYGPSINNAKDPLFINGEPAFGQEFNAEALRHNNYIPVTALVRTSWFLQVGGFPSPGTPEWPHTECEDWGLWLRLRDAGAIFSHLPERTWQWNVHGKNTSGRPDAARRHYGAKP